MARALEEILGARLSEGAVVTKYGHAQRLEQIRVIEAAHPVPDANSVSGARELCDIASEANEHTLILSLISGGGSALFCLPEEGISLADKQRMTQVLLESGADIREINTVRKHISRVKGGKFARMAYPARLINLILPDVIGDRLDSIASGISVPDATTFAEAAAIIQKYGIDHQVPPSITRFIQAGLEGGQADTPKAGDRAFKRVANILLGNNLAACRAAARAGEECGYRTVFLTSSLTGEAREIAHFFAALARDLDQGLTAFERPALLIAGGETTVTIRGDGKGGRNQELALAFLVDLLATSPDLERIVFLSGGTDGQDGPTDAAGAVISAGVRERITALELDPGTYLARNDAYRFFEQTGSLLMTGPTGTNVCDLQLLIVA